MLFSSLVFLSGFLPAVLLIYYVFLRGRRKAQNVFLLLASLGFYAWGEPWFVFVMMLSIIGNWIFGLLVDRYRTYKFRAKSVITISLVFNLGIIFIFKYLMFTVSNVNKLFGTSISCGKIILPIGISFFTFQAISYVIDIYRQRGEVQKNPLNVGLYISFFPQLIAGPIVRYQTVAKQINNRTETFQDFSEGVKRFITGLGKKILIANNVALIANYSFNLGSDNRSVAFAWLGALAYTLQIYFDFSGYSDMAIGLGKMFGFHFMENFDYPYISKSCSEFWRRWHISLGSWFRDYVYIPLGGSRVSGKKRLIFNLLIVWFLTGLWHGANWTFICWGLLYFVFISVEKLSGFEKKGNSVLAASFKHVYTMFLVVMGWVIFRAVNINVAIDYIKTMFVPSKAGVIDEIFKLYISEYGIFIIAGLIFSLPVAKKISESFNKKIKWEESYPTAFLYGIVMILIMLVSISYLVKGAYNPFIYFNF